RLLIEMIARREDGEGAADRRLQDQADAQDVGIFPPGGFVILSDVSDDDAEADELDEKGDDVQDHDEGQYKASGQGQRPECPVGGRNGVVQQAG
ncbi:MAG: hypothetical protein LQ348_006429, partial [Seirophora lacunosa]